MGRRLLGVDVPGVDAMGRRPAGPMAERWLSLSWWWACESRRGRSRRGSGRCSGLSVVRDRLRGLSWLIGQVRALPPERGGTTPAAALTAYTGPEHRVSVLRAGFQYHVANPVSMHELLGGVAVLAFKEHDRPVNRERPDRGVSGPRPP